MKVGVTPKGKVKIVLDQEQAWALNRLLNLSGKMVVKNPGVNDYSWADEDSFSPVLWNKINNLQQELQVL